MWDAVKFGEASRSLGRHKAAHRRTITHRLRRRRLQRAGPQRKPFSGGFVVAAAEKEEEEGEVFIASSSLLRSRQFAPAKRGGELRRTGRREEETRKGKSPRVLPLFRSVLESGGDLPRALHTSVIPSNRVSSSSVVVANFCTPSAHRPTDRRPNSLHRSGRGKNTKGACAAEHGGRRRRVEDRKPRGRERGKKVK